MDLKEFLQNTYIEKRTSDFHASQLFKAKQGKDEKVTSWIHRTQTLGSQFREAALLNCRDSAREGIIDLADRLRNICFVQGLASDRIQTIVRSRNYQTFDDIAETALIEENAISSRLDRYRVEASFSQKCGNCGKLGHSSSRCYTRSKAETRVNPVVSSGSGTARPVTCFRCGEQGNFARNCRRPPRRREGNDPPIALSGNESRRTERSRPTVACTQ